MTHAILPVDLCAYKDLALDVVATVLTARGPTEAAARLGVSGEVWIRRVRRWRRQARESRARQAERVLPELTAPAPWWERALETYGSLSRWRLREWRATHHFATVLLGLFRRGRPPWVVAELST